MSLAKKYPVITSSKIIEEVCKELGISKTEGHEIYRGWRSLMKDIALKTEQANIIFSNIGSAYYLLKPHKKLTKKDEKLFRKKRKEIEYYLGKERIQDSTHCNVPVYKFYGINRKNKETNRKYTLKELSKIQERNFIDENFKEAEKYNMG